ncbi:hypothetical protein BuS5_00225 [Desulfosarcina sp. BuS5]|uniref:hybrid sensor histidine kinase/response regulator n=1 Tax=Desulfosarcina sp. BuS5 TaxID=933262 RepID=UPI0005544AFE|nr:response regulator [Desulfosarcina sp. BuS5]WDN87257.1 hypothetical protein BuS5_00225 [Desulfosarcina sp. BuS5]
MRTDITVNSNIRLLLVDDEEDFRKTIAKRLKKRGFAPEEAGSGNECLALLENKAVDIVVLDVKMPGMDGIETLRHIKEKFSETEVILLTGHAVTSDGISGIKSGAFDYLSKPIEFEHLLSKIKQAYNKIIREEEKRKDAEFRASMEQQMIATERLASLGTLSAGVAHEINNPLAIINESVGWMRLILQKDELAEMPRKKDFEKALGKIEKGVDRARKITHQLLETVRKNNSVFTQVDLKELAREAVELLGQETKNRNIQFFYEMEESACTIWSDPYQVRQVLINLLTNAAHSMDTGGEITIILKADVDDIVLTVRDTGTGIPKENLDKIFEPFFSTKSPGQGTGLGLFVTRSIINKLGGRIEVESRLGHGTSFNITLPKYYEI